MLIKLKPSWTEALLDSPQGAALIQRLGEALALEPDPLIGAFVRHLRRTYREELAAIIFYGSCLFEQTRTTTSFPDFYLLTDNLWRLHSSCCHAGLNLVLPPNVYYARFQTAPGELGGATTTNNLSCKYCVMSLGQFFQETSPRAHDVHHLGRFSKRFMLAYSCDPKLSQVVARSSARAILTLIPHALALLPKRFTLEELILQVLGLSYLGEQRVAEPDKVQRLYEASADHYRQVFGQALELYAGSRGELERGLGGSYRQRPPLPTNRENRENRENTERFLRRSRLRGVLRWPKYILTVDNWLQYILDKLERHQGISLELTERERRYPLIFGWRKFFALKRKGAVG